ncbi:YceD family protein, partial [Bosea sp. CER48]|uniref:YceD family protein n=1 Tax=Bosea sp. CER48 TaxID=3377035 RepID=UPI00381D1973
KLEGRILARLHQTCVVTLDAFPVQLDVPVKLDFAPEEEIEAASRRAERDDAEIDIEVLLNEDDPPEPIIDGVIDLGGVTLEFLALALDPYPRKPGVSFEAPAAEPGAESPFAALAKLKRGD